MFPEARGADTLCSGSSGSMVSSNGVDTLIIGEVRVEGFLKRELPL
jgi:hypothetical protein